MQQDLCDPQSARASNHLQGHELHRLLSVVCYPQYDRHWYHHIVRKYIRYILLTGYVNPDVLVIDDFANTKMTEEDALQIFKVMEYRYGFKSTIIASQLEPTEWHRNFGASQLADSILDRIVSNAYKIILSGDSLRPKKIED